MEEGLKAAHISKAFGETAVLHDVSFTAQKGELVALLGGSGSGKTTLLRIIAGLETADNGRVEASGKGIGLVFQEYALFPHLTVAKNIAFGLQKHPAQKERIAAMLQLVEMEGYAARYPHHLSGGQQQRVAIARALAPAPSVLLLDEPFSNLDASLRRHVRQDIAAILKKTATTGVFVTHDVQDALAIADKIIVLHEGRIVQEATPEALSSHPNHTEVAQLFGNRNVIPADFTEGQVKSSLGTYRSDVFKAGHHYLVFRYEDVLLNVPEGVKAVVKNQQFAGKHYEIALECGKLEVTGTSPTPIAAGTEVTIALEPTTLHAF